MPDFLMIHDVVSAGAGPVGLFLACELRLAGLSVLVLEQTEHPHSPLKRLPFGMRGLSAPTIEAFYRRGLLDDMTAPQREKDQSTSAHWMQQPRRPFRRHSVLPRHHRHHDVALSPARSGRYQHGEAAQAASRWFGKA
nr:FAD-dependent monooxygenase [Rhizobium leguminosarum]